MPSGTTSVQPALQPQRCLLQVNSDADLPFSKSWFWWQRFGWALSAKVDSSTAFLASMTLQVSAESRAYSIQSHVFCLFWGVVVVMEEVMLIKLTTIKIIFSICFVSCTCVDVHILKQILHCVSFPSYVNWL